MDRIGLAFGFAMVAAVPMASSAAAQSNGVSYVAVGGTGSTCTSAEPCSTFSEAHTATVAGGTIKCLTPYNFSGVDITKPITIDCGGVGASSLPSRAFFISINEATYPDAVVTIRGVAMQGAQQRGVSVSIDDGIRWIGGGAGLIIEDCRIEGYGDKGIEFAPTSSVNLIVRNTLISNNAGGGVQISPASGVNLRATFSGVSFDRNGPYGLQAGDGALVDVTDSTVSQSAIGFFAASFNRGVDIILDRATVSSNMRGLVGAGANGSVRVSNSLITGNSLGIDGNVISLGGNSFTLNNTDGTFKATIAKR